MSPHFAIALCLAPFISQIEPPPALYVLENVASNRRTVDACAVVRITFDGDRTLVKETILTRDARFFGWFPGREIALGRYLLADYGGVVDLQSKKVIHEEQHGSLLGVEGGKVFFRLNNSNRVSGLFSFDLNSHETAKVDSGTHWDLPGIKSPDKTQSATMFGKDDGLRIHRLDKEPIDVGSGFGFSLSPLASGYLDGLPRLWIDANHLLTTRSNRKLVRVSLRGEVETFAEIEGPLPDPISPPNLWLDPLGRILYSCGEKHFLIDIRAKTARPLDRLAWGNGFEVSLAIDKLHRNTIYRDGKEIGRWAVRSWPIPTAPGRIAFRYVEPKENPIAMAWDGAAGGVAVWTAESNRWQASKAWVSTVVGWAK